jgi:hypothetical protein
MLKMSRFHAGTCAVVQLKLPALVASMLPPAIDTLPAVAVRGAAESYQANIECKVKTFNNHERNFVI